jgi:hypothetical protein
MAATPPPALDALFENSAEQRENDLRLAVAELEGRLHAAQLALLEAQEQLESAAQVNASRDRAEQAEHELLARERDEVRHKSRELDAALARLAKSKNGCLACEVLRERVHALQAAAAGRDAELASAQRHERAACVHLKEAAAMLERTLDAPARAMAARAVDEETKHEQDECD